MTPPKATTYDPSRTKREQAFDLAVSGFLLLGVALIFLWL